MKDIENIEDIKLFVDEFYSKVREDELLAPIFGMRIESGAWEKHLNRMYDFWNTVLFFQRSYKGNPFSKHADLPINEEHFMRWTGLFKEVIDNNFKGEHADETKRRVDKMAQLFIIKLGNIRENPSYKSIV